MKLKEGFVLREIDQEYLVVPVQERAKEIHGIISLSETGAFLWKLLASETKEEDLIKAVLEEYDAEEKVAETDVKDFLKEVSKHGFLV